MYIVIGIIAVVVVIVLALWFLGAFDRNSLGGGGGGGGFEDEYDPNRHR